MPNFIISPYAISWESIKNQLEEYVKDKTEDETWKDFYVSGAGQTVIELAAALGAFYAYHFIVGRRECYLSSAQNYTSVVGLSENNGYSVSRGTNLKIDINYTPSETISLRKWDKIGSYSDEYDVILLEDFNGENELIAGREYKLPCVIGKLVNGNDVITVPSEKLMAFSFHDSSTTEDFRLILNNVEVPTSTQFKDLMKDYWVTLTNPYGSIDAFYLQQGQFKYHPNDILYIQFIQRNNLTWSVFSPTRLLIEIPGNLSDSGVELNTDRIDQEDLSQAKVKAPLYHETSMMIRSRKDYSKYLLLANPKLIDANDRDITPGLIELTYLTKDGSILSQQEIDTWLDNIEETRPSGVARALISHPVQIARDLVVKIWKQETGTSSTLDDQIDEILEFYNNRLGIQLDLNQIEHDIERLDGVKIARVYTENGSWESNTPFKLFDTITNEEGNTFRVSSFSFKSGSSEPNWSSVSDGQTINDGEIVWERVPDFDGTVIHTWTANTSYAKYDYIKKEQLTSGTYGQSGSYPPAWGRQTVDDYRLQWTKLTSYSGTPKQWQPSISFNKNDVVQVSSEGQSYYYKCTTCYKYVDSLIFRVCNFIGKTGSTAPIWFTADTQDGAVIKTYKDIVYDGNIVWSKYNDGVIPESPISWSANTNMVVGTNIKIDNDYYYTATSLSGISGNTEPNWPSYTDGECIDNNIVWIMMEENARTLNLQWNEYFKLIRIS